MSANHSDNPHARVDTPDNRGPDSNGPEKAEPEVRTLESVTPAGSKHNQVESSTGSTGTYASTISAAEKKATRQPVASGVSPSLAIVLGVLAVIFILALAILNSSTAPEVTPPPFQPLATETGRQGNFTNLGNQSASDSYNRGVASNRKGDFDQAIADLAKAIQIEPVNASFYTELRLCFPWEDET